MSVSASQKEIAHVLASQAKHAARRVAALSTEEKNKALHTMAEGVAAHQTAILEANARDINHARTAKLSDAMIDRLLLTAPRIDAMVQGVRDVANLDDPVGASLQTLTRPNGLIIDKVRCPIGVMLVIYESRPNVTADAASLCFKAGNAVILRGGSEAVHSNHAILDAMLGNVGDFCPAGAIQLTPTTDRALVAELLQLDELIDLVIPRGGEGLIRAVAEQSRIPVLKHYKGVCHVYVDRAADMGMALRIAINAKCSRPGVCNAMETLLVHEDVAETFLPQFAELAVPFNVELRCDEKSQAFLPNASLATEDDWRAEYLDMILAVRIVSDVEGAIDHIEQYGSHHTDAIVTADEAVAGKFMREVDSATVYINASTRFTDGAEFGKGAEIGISTDKLHARGPCGIEELTTYKYVIHGSGQIRE